MNDRGLLLPITAGYDHHREMHLHATRRRASCRRAKCFPPNHCALNLPVEATAIDAAAEVIMPVAMAVIMPVAAAAVAPGTIRIAFTHWHE